MKVIAGLGNPGPKYAETRHNVGFKAMDQLTNKLELSWKEDKKSLMCETRVGTEKVLLLKPMTYMNLSGEAIQPVMSFYNLDVDDLLVIYDDLDLETGALRLRLKGGHGGHNGIRSIIDHLGAKDFKRIRIGVGHPNNGNSVISHVLGTFAPDEKKAVHDAIDLSAQAAEMWLTHPFNDVMNHFNRKKS
ncbi:peptidyl-tRNA hydrolase [Alteribacillus persepolensis]|uniref:Peptidyl-tRNA hydrolase n=1 Tax=Alteribacillus persepolensis TaxID=568899 RepID=A0A1G8HZL0_9BACI|nr:aminoacyl-tRNA hydrolase [Alteribacillus persepolensis]SDI12078.1 peptidyl-tRNA hydrolase [Alteribacillus persepolensis]